MKKTLAVIDAEKLAKLDAIHDVIVSNGNGKEHH